MTRYSRWMVVATWLTACTSPAPGILGLEGPAGPCASAQHEWVVGDEAWYEVPRFIAPTADGHLVVASEATTGNLEYANFVRLVTTGGEVVWDAQLAGPEVPDPKAIGYFLDHGSQTLTDMHSVLPTDDGGMVVVGTAGYTISIQDLWLTQLDKNGNEVWRQVYPEQGGQYPMAARRLTGGDMVVVATSRVGLNASAALGIPKRPDDVRVLRVDAAGQVLHTSRHGGPTAEWLVSAGVLSDGSAVFLADLDDDDPQNGTKEFWLVGTAPDTSLAWERTMALKYAPVVVATPSGPVMARAESDAVMVEGLEPTTGEARWEAVFPVSVDASALRMAHDATGTWVGQVTDRRLWVARLSPDGEVQWDTVFDTDITAVDALSITPTGELVSLARRQDGNGFVLVTQSVSADGALEWVQERAPADIAATLFSLVHADGDAFTLGTAPDGITALVHLGPDCNAEP